MSGRPAFRFWCFLGIFLFSGCFSNSEKLVGRYYLELSVDGAPGLFFDDPRVGRVLLASPHETAVIAKYVVVHDGKFYWFPVAANSVAAARNGQIGPMTEAQCKQKAYQLTGDSLRLRLAI